MRISWRLSGSARPRWLPLDGAGLGSHLLLPNSCADVSATSWGLCCGLRWPGWIWLHIPSCMSYNYANASQIFVNPRLRSSGEVEKATRSPSRTVQYLVATTWEATTTRPLSSSRGSVLARQLSHPPLVPRGYIFACRRLAAL
ncbi:hypothetical protein HDV62DRAFT_130170 [Trichoderma sp. SZMC 28011]